MEYKSNKEYPKIMVEKENPEYAKIILEDYAGIGSEETAIHTYIYQNIVLDGEIADTIKHIAMVEMHHLKILGELIHLLGCQPGFYTIDSNIGYIIPWTSNNVDYNTILSDVILGNISREMNAIRQYKNHIQEIDDIYVKKVLERIVEDEEVHIECFKNLYHKYLGKSC
jgi:Mn-containing catalase